MLQATSAVDASDQTRVDQNDTKLNSLTQVPDQTPGKDPEPTSRVATATELAERGEEETDSSQQAEVDAATPDPRGEEGAAPLAVPAVAPERGKEEALPLSPSAEAPVREASRPRAADDGANEVYTPAPISNPVLHALKQSGLYRAQADAGVHRITCPWEHQHDIASNGSATYVEPTESHPEGRFCCPHQHPGRPRVTELLDYLNMDPFVARGMAVIRVLPGEMSRIADAAERILALAGDIYQFGNQIVRVCRDPLTGDVRTEPLNEGSLSKILSANAVWLKVGKEPCRIDPPPRHVAMLVRASSYRHLPILKGLARQPYLAPDGQVVVAAGYDASTHTYGAFAPEDFPMPPPTEAAAREALARLKDLLREFHLRGEHDRSAGVCLMLTAAMRSQLPLAPAFNISASTSGSGKSYLAGIAALFAGPGQPMNVSYPVRAEEASKAVLTMLLTQPAVVLFDDMQTNWIPHSIINKMLTSEVIADRLLGGNQSASVGTATLVLGTGNNREPERDLRRRVVTIYLSPMSSTPATLKYEGRPDELVRGARGRYVADALTIVRAWIAAGRPLTEVHEIGSFGAWSNLCRQPLLWLGEPDPATSLIQQVEVDPETDVFGALIKAWHLEFGKNSAMSRTVIDRAEAKSEGELYRAMEEAPFMEQRGVNRHKFGQYLGRHANRVACGLQLVRVDCTERNAWAVVPMGTSPSGHEAHGKRPFRSPYGYTAAAAHADDGEIY